MWFLHFLKDLTEDGLIGWMMLIMIVILLFILFGLLFHAVDRIGIKAKPEEVTVIGRSYTPAHTIMVSNNINGTTVMTPTVIPESWSLEVMDKRRHVMGCYVSQYEYNNVPSGAILTGMVGYGRLTSYKYCTALITNS